jgi:hypothetical protein
MQDFLLPCEADNILHGEKEGRVVLACDEHELVLDLLHDSGRRSIRVTALQPLPGQPFEPRLQVFAVGRDLIGIFVGQFFEAERAATREFSRVGDRLRVVREQPRHFTWAFQMPLGIATKPEARLVYGARLADAGEHILQAAARRIMIEDVVGRDEGHARGFGEDGQTMKPFRLVAKEAMGGGEIDAAFELRRQILQMPLKAFGFFRAVECVIWRRDRNDLPF